MSDQQPPAKPGELIVPGVVEVCATAVNLDTGQIFFKLVGVRARQMTNPFWLKCPKTGEVSRGKAGDWLVEGPNGGRWACADKLFRKTYFTRGQAMAAAEADLGKPANDASPSDPPELPAPAPQAGSDIKQ